MKKTIIAFAIVLVGLVAVHTNVMADNDKPISVSQLPEVAQKLISTHFAGKKVALSKQDTEVFDKSYDVVFTTGEKIEFDRKGNWTEIDCKQSSVPSALVPQQIRSYVETNYPGTAILSIEKDRKEYEIKLSNRMEVTFNKSFQVIDID